MAYFKILEPNKEAKYIKDVDRQNEELTFSTNRDGCYQEDEGFYADSAFDFLKFHFTEKYPELEYMTIVNSYDENIGEATEAVAVEGGGW